MKLAILNPARRLQGGDYDDAPPAPEVATSLLDRAVGSLPEGARFLVYPAGRNARLAVQDLPVENKTGARTFVGFADDSHSDPENNCLSLGDAVRSWRPTHLILCARQAELERALGEKAMRQFPDLCVVSPREMLVDAWAPAHASPRALRPLAAIKKITIVMCKTCNIRCSFCYQTDFTQRMDPAIVDEKLVPLYPFVDAISLVGGEVTAYRHGLPFAQRIAEQYAGTTLDITTNAILFDQRWTDVFCRTGGHVRNSLVAATPGTYRDVTGQDKHGQAVANVRHAIKARNERNAALRVTAGMVITPQTQHEVAAFFELGMSMNVDAVEYGVDSLTMDQLDRRMIKSQVESILDASEGRVVWDRVSLLYPDLLVEPTFTRPCTKASDHIYVEVNGDVFVCCHSHLRIGSLSTDDIETIWNSREAFAVEQDVELGYCATCPRDCIYRPATARYD